MSKAIEEEQMYVLKNQGVIEQLPKKETEVKFSQEERHS